VFNNVKFSGKSFFGKGNVKKAVQKGIECGKFVGMRGI